MLSFMPCTHTENITSRARVKGHIQVNIVKVGIKSDYCSLRFLTRGSGLVSLTNRTTPTKSNTALQSVEVLPPPGLVDYSYRIHTTVC